MEAIKYRFNYVALIENIERFPNILEGSRDVFEKVRDLAAAEFQEQDDDEGYGIIHGNFWTGNVLIPNTPLTEQSETMLFVVDWEGSQLGNRA